MSRSYGFFSHTARHRYGFALVELLVALVISLFLLAGMIQLFIGNRQAYRFQSAMSRVQENGRFALEILSRDIRMIDFTGCPPSNTVVNVLNNPTTWWENFGVGSLVGYEGTEDTFPGKAIGTNPRDRVEGTDAAVFLGSSGGYFITATAPTATPPTFTLNQLDKPDGGSLGLGDIVIICDAQRTSIFQITAVDTNASTIAHAIDVVTPGNSTANLFPSNIPDSYVPNESTLIDFVPNAFYVGVSSSGNSQSLYRLQLQVTTAGVASMEAQELIDGVMDMQIVYGEDTNNDQIADHYVDASDVAAADWPNIMSVRVSLLLASLDNNVVNQEQTVFFPEDTGSSTTSGRSFTASDRRLYQTFSTTVGIRNRLP